MVTYGDWTKPRFRIRVKDLSNVFQDISDRLMSGSVQLNSSYAVDSFRLKLDNIDGYLSSNFTYGKEIEISATFDQDNYDIILSGRIEDPEQSTTRTEGSVWNITGKDWTSDLLNNYIQVELYKNGTFTASTDPYIGEIVRDLVLKYAPTIDASAVPDTATQIDYKIFSRISAFEAIKFLADFIDYRFYVDVNKKLIFEEPPEDVLVDDDFMGSGDPAGWTENSGTWAIASNKYAQTNASGDHTSYRTNEDFVNLTIDADLEVASGTSAGFAMRIDGSGNHYYLALDFSANEIRLYTVATWTGSKTQLASAAKTFSFGTNYHVRVFIRPKGDNIVFHVFIDDMRACLLTYEDAAPFTDSGKVGCHTEDAVATFDNFVAGNGYLVIDEGFNTKDIKIKEQLSRVKNRIYVQGGYEKFPEQETFTPSGSTDTITLASLPSEVQVSVSGVLQKGGISGIDDNDVSVYFLVDYYGKKLIRRGTNWSAVSTVVNYNRNVPLIGSAEDESANDTEIGARVYVQQDKLLNTQSLCDLRAEALLDKMRTPPRSGSAIVPGVVWPMIPGDYVLVRTASNGLPDFDLLRADSISISFDKNSAAGLVFTFQLDNEDASLALLLNSMDARIKKLERRDIPEALLKIEPFSEDCEGDDSISGESNDISNAFKLGHYAKLGHYRKLGNASGGWTPAF